MSKWDNSRIESLSVDSRGDKQDRSAEYAQTACDLDFENDLSDFSVSQSHEISDSYSEVRNGILPDEIFAYFFETLTT